jgi:hypothetical protein
MHAVRTASRHPVCRLAFSPCGSWLAAAQPHHGITLHDRASGAAVRTVGSPRRPDYTSVTFLRDGAWLAAAGSKGLEVFDTATGDVVGTNSRWFMCGLRLGCRGGVVLAGGAPSILEILLPPEGGEVGRRGYLSVDGVAYYEPAPDGRWAVGFREGGNPVAIDLSARRVAHTLAHPVRARWYDQSASALAVGFASDSSRVAIGDGATVSVFDLHSAGEAPSDLVGIPAPYPVVPPVFTLPPPDRWPAGTPWQPPFALTPDGRQLMVLRPRQRVQMWNVDEGTLEAEWSWRLEGITCLAIAPDGLTAVAGGRFGRVLTWDLG